jgi:hypothetical protein
MIDPLHFLSDPAVAVSLRVAFGGYVIYMARKFYADPTGYFRKTAARLVDLRWLEPTIRALACFCLWGGCFIVATAVAVQIFDLHGDVLAIALVMLAALATWLLLPKQREAGAEDKPSIQD